MALLSQLVCFCLRYPFVRQLYRWSGLFLCLTYVDFLSTVPFIILSIDNGQSPEDVDPNANPGDNSQVSHETGILLALFAAGLLGKFKPLV